MRIKAVVGFAAFLAVASLGLAVAVNGAALGQNTQQTQPPPGPPPGPPGMGPHGGDIGRLLFELDLTAEQVEKVKALLKTERETASSYVEESRKLDEQLRTEIEKDTFNVETVTALIKQQADLMVKIKMIGAHTQSDIYQLLTAEQKASLAKMHAEEPPPPPPDGARPHRGR